MRTIPSSSPQVADIALIVPKNTGELRPQKLESTATEALNKSIYLIVLSSKHSIVEMPWRKGVRKQKKRFNRNIHSFVSPQVADIPKSVQNEQPNDRPPTFESTFTRSFNKNK